MYFKRLQIVLIENICSIVRLLKILTNRSLKNTFYNIYINIPTPIYYHRRLNRWYRDHDTNIATKSALNPSNC